MSLSFVLAGDLATFDKAGFKSSLQTQFSTAERVSVVYTAASVQANATLSYVQASTAQSARTLIASTDAATMASNWFGGSVSILNEPSATMALEVNTDTTIIDNSSSPVVAIIVTLVVLVLLGLAAAAAWKVRAMNKAMETRRQEKQDEKESQPEREKTKQEEKAEECTFWFVSAAKLLERVDRGEVCKGRMWRKLDEKPSASTGKELDGALAKTLQEALHESIQAGTLEIDQAKWYALMLTENPNPDLARLTYLENKEADLVKEKGKGAKLGTKLAAELKDLKAKKAELERRGLRLSNTCFIESPKGSGVYFEPDDEELPKFQELREREGFLKQHKVTRREAFRHRYGGEYLAISHRWFAPDAPDKDGLQLSKIKVYLREHPTINWVWFDYWCMPQGKKTPGENVSFKYMLGNINWLYIGCSVLVLLDLSYLSRFWTQFEAWLSLQLVVEGGGLQAATSDSTRTEIVPIYNGTEDACDLLRKTWANQTPEKAHDILAMPDVTVTNQGDKDMQLPKILSLNDEVKSVMGGGEKQEVNVEVKSVMEASDHPAVELEPLQDTTQLRQAVSDVTSEALGAAAKQILVASPDDLASVKRMMQMANTLPSTFMDKVADAVGVDSAFVRTRRPELIAHVESILAADSGLNA